MSDFLANFLTYRREILTFQLEREKLFLFAHIAYAYVVKTDFFFSASDVIPHDRSQFLNSS